MPRKSQPQSGSSQSLDPVTSWAQDVVDGRIVSGELMWLAAERHLRDRRDARWHWDEKTARHTMEFFPNVLSVTAGAMSGRPFELPGYLGFVVGSLFGWHHANGRLRYREAWLELGKGMVKTPLAAAIGLYVMGWRGTSRAEVYAIAKDRNQASVLFNDAVALCRAPIPGSSDTLESIGQVILRGTGEMTWMIEHQESQSKFRVLANDEKISGPRPSMVCGDEIHEWKSMGQIELWKAALTKMAGDGLLMLTTNTPAADQVAATEMSDYYQGVLRGQFRDESAFALIARVDRDDKPMEDESCWLKALPLLGTTFPIENVRGAVASSKHRMATALATKRLYFGIPVGASEYWIDVDAWEAVQGEVNESSHTDDPCYLSLDLSQKNDLTALGATWDTGDKLHAKVWYWRPDYNVLDAARADGAQYVEWAADGYLNLVPGRAIEYEFVAAKIQSICVAHRVVSLAFDPAHITEFRKACERIGFKTWIYDPEKPAEDGLKMIVHAQGRQGMQSKKTLWMPRSLQLLEDRVLKEEIVIDRSPITTWCSGNAATQPDAQNNRWFVKKRQRGRIDGLVALAMGTGAAELKEQPAPPKEYQMFIVGRPSSVWPRPRAQ